jgi:prolipoprotein diacylglyceryl transferase
MTLTFAFDPVIAELGPFQLGWHGIFSAIAVLVAVWLAGRLALQRGIPTEVVYAIAGWGVVGGLIGARLFHLADHLSYYLENPLRIPAIWEGGIAVYGAFIGGLVGGFIAAWRSHLDPWPLLDIAAPSMLVGQGIGRLGCLCNGDAWGGDATGCPFCLAIRYTNQNDLLPANLRGVPTYARRRQVIGQCLHIGLRRWPWTRRARTLRQAACAPHADDRHMSGGGLNEHQTASLSGGGAASRVAPCRQGPASAA